jgi:hypothetical protein
MQWDEYERSQTDVDGWRAAHRPDYATFERLRTLYPDLFDFENGASRRRGRHSGLRQKIFAALRRRIAEINCWPKSFRTGRSESEFRS